jgi:hypothetical protein
MKKSLKDKLIPLIKTLSEEEQQYILAAAGDTTRIESYSDTADEATEAMLPNIKQGVTSLLTSVPGRISIGILGIANVTLDTDQEVQLQIVLMADKRAWLPLGIARIEEESFKTAGEA